MALLIGWAEESLVPEKKVRLAGQFYERISAYVESEITATAMAVEADGEQMILISADIAHIPAYLLREIRARFAQRNSEVDPMKLVIAATHTHTSHVMADPHVEADGFGSTINVVQEYVGEGKEYVALVTADDSVMAPQEATLFVAEQIAAAADKAWRNRKAAYYTNEFGRAAVGMCRRVSYDDGTAQMWGDTNTANFVALEGGNDSGIELLYFFDENKALTGIVANIACPAQILEQRSFISADYWGRAKANIREKLGDHIFLLGLCGAGGDQCPRDLVRWIDPETPIDDPNVKRPNLLKRKADPSMYDISGCNKAGKRISNEILSVFEEISELRDDAPFQHKVLSLDLPLRKVTLTDYNAADAALKQFASTMKEGQTLTFEDSARLHIHAGTITRFRVQQTQELFGTEIHVVRFGDVALVTCPFELFLDYGNRVKARSYAHQTFLAQLTCGSCGYLPTAKAEKAGHYSAYVSSGNIGHEGGDLMVRTMIEQINAMFRE